MRWPQVRGLSYGTMGRAVRAEIYSGNVFLGRVRYLPATSWRIEDADGTPTYIENDTDEYRRAEDAVMMRTVKSPHRIVMTGGASPSVLLQAYHAWLPSTTGTMQPRLVPTSEPERVEVHGRAGWQVPMTDTQYGTEVTYVIDAELGVALSWRQGAQSMYLLDPVLDEEFDPALFDWTGPVRECDDHTVSPAQREHEAKRKQLDAMPHPAVGWLPRTVDVHPVDGDPRTGALDLQVTGVHSSILLRQWISDVGEPELGWLHEHCRSQYRATVGAWTYEIRSHTDLDPGDCARIIDSITPAAPPARTPAQIRDTLAEDAAAQADAELDELLGTGQRLDDYLDDRYGVSLLIRTDFTDTAAWRETVKVATAPAGGDESEFAAVLTCIDNREYDGLTIPALLDAIGDRPVFYVFIADHTTITDPEHPILAVDTGPEETGHVRGSTFRVIPTCMWMVENNLSLANVDFDEFARDVGPDGIYRGFD